MSVELIGIIAASIALGTAWLASIRSLRQELRDMRVDMKAMEGGIRDDMKAMEGGIRDGMKAMEGGIRDEMRAMEGGIRDGMKAMEGGIRDEMRAGFKELTERVTSIGDRLSKVEGIIEGMFWSGRSQPPDKPREGAA